ncbi:MAG: ATP phosphoribosyltransferase regulatory subunit [Mariprofundaceae bacterium]
MNAPKPLPGLDDAFGARARDLRRLQRALAEVFEGAGYEEVIPPLVERPESLKSGAGRFLADQTVVFSDPAEAGLLAIRPDMTPQVARIAATRLLDDSRLRLYYSGPVMLARPESAGGSRQPWQMGVECLGVPGQEGDAEVIRLAARCMEVAGFSAPVLLVGHIGLLRSLTRGSDLPLERWAEVLMRRSPDDMRGLLDGQGGVDDFARQALLELAAGGADAGWLAERAASADAPEGFAAAAAELLDLVEGMGMVGAEVRVDAATMPRFLYHSGIVFAGYAAGASRVLVHGGRYDAMMAAHGRDMPATGFSCDLWTWLDMRAGT